MARITIYEHANYIGAAFGTTDSLTSLSPLNLNDKVSSVDVESGRWELFEHDNFAGQRWIVDADGGPSRSGAYPTPQSWGGPNDIVSSLRRIG